MTKISDIVRTVSDVTGVTAAEILSDDRHRPAVRARFMVCYLAKDWRGESLPKIGRCLNNRCHTTILHAVRWARENRNTDAKFAEELRTCQAILSETGDPYRSSIRKQWKDGVHVGVIMRSLGVSKAHVYEAVR